jgi:hypothetical protein
MKMLRFILLSLGILCLSVPAWADQVPGTDPRVIIGGGKGSLSVGDTFLFSSATGSSPATSPCVVNGVPENDCVFQNGTSSTFTTLSLDIDETLPPGSEVDCGVVVGGPFTACTFEADADGYFFTFSGGPGVAPGGDFMITLDSWNPNTNVGVGANGMTPPDPGTPEPGTVVLLLTGIGALALALRTKASAPRREQASSSGLL